MKILLINEHILGQVSGEETFWSIFGKYIPNVIALELKNFKGNITEYIKEVNPDVLIYNSLLGNILVPKKTKKIVLLQDNFILMDKILPKTLRQKVSQLLKREKSFFKKNIGIQKEAIRNSDVVVSVSENVASTYGVTGPVIPIGTDAELFCPMDKQKVRKELDIPENKKVKIFVGSTHNVKGFDLILKEIKKDFESLYLIVLKDDKIPNIKMKNVRIYNKVSQKELVKLYNCADLYVGRSRVETLWLAPIEAMFSGVPIDVTPVGIFTNWQPKNEYPREEAFLMHLDKETMLKKWQELLGLLFKK